MLSCRVMTWSARSRSRLALAWAKAARRVSCVPCVVLRGPGGGAGTGGAQEVEGAGVRGVQRVVRSLRGGAGIAEHARSVQGGRGGHVRWAWGAGEGCCRCACASWYSATATACALRPVAAVLSSCALIASISIARCAYVESRSPTAFLAACLAAICSSFHRRCSCCWMRARWAKLRSSPRNCWQPETDSFGSVSPVRDGSSLLSALLSLRSYSLAFSTPWKVFRNWETPTYFSRSARRRSCSSEVQR